MNPEELRSLGRRDPSRAFDEAREAIKSEDRNLRVAALRIAGQSERPEAAELILAGLKDQKRRVRQVALSECKPFLVSPAVVGRIVDMIEDEKETPRLRSHALFALGGTYPSPNRAGSVPRVAVKALESLAAAESLRGVVLQRLVMMDLTEDVKPLLREFVRSGSKDEAVAATRALCGYRLVNWGNATPRELEAAGGESAGGVMYWIRREASGPSY